MSPIILPGPPVFLDAEMIPLAGSSTVGLFVPPSVVANEGKIIISTSDISDEFGSPMTRDDTTGRLWHCRVVCPAFCCCQ